MRTQNKVNAESSGQIPTFKCHQCTFSVEVKGNDSVQEAINHILSHVDTRFREFILAGLGGIPDANVARVLLTQEEIKAVQKDGKKTD